MRRGCASGSARSRDGIKAFEASDIDPRPETLVITDTELEFLRKLAPLVDTPRAAKRLLNTYQLVRVSVEDVPQFLERSGYEPLLVLLALVTSSPGLTASMVRSVLGSGEPDLPSFLDNLDAADDADNLGWMRVRDDLSRCPCGSVTVTVMRQWLPVVSRFSFQPGLARLGAPHASLRRYGTWPRVRRLEPGLKPWAEDQPAGTIGRSWVGRRGSVPPPCGRQARDGLGPRAQDLRPRVVERAAAAQQPG
jgi:hypothetical protein